MDFTWRKAILAAVLFGTATLLGLSAWSHLSGGPGGVTGVSLKPCPDRPNCVCSFATDEQHAIDPIAFEGDMEDAMALLVEVLTAMPGCEVQAVEEGYVHATFTTKYLRFVDDVEFVPSWEDGAIHVRSASRVGISDLGTNRERVERIRAALAAAE